MTVFSMRGSKIFTNPDGQISQVEGTTLEAVTRIGANTLDTAYLGDPENSFAISLGDYNLLFDGIHINDADLPTHIELFDLVADVGLNTRVLNFVFESQFGIEERMYTIGQTPLPQFQSPSEASLFLAEREPVTVTPSDQWTIQLDLVHGVETSGVFIKTDMLDTQFDFEPDGFAFLNIGAEPDVETWDDSFATAAALDHALSEVFEPSISNDNSDAAQDDLIKTTDPDAQPVDFDVG